MTDVNKLWEETKKLFENEPQKHLLNVSASQIKGIYKFSNGYIYLIVDTSLNKLRIQKFYLNTFNRLLKTLTTENILYDLICECDIKEDKKQDTEIKEPILSSFQHRALRAEYTFETFTVGEANKEAYTFAEKVALSPNVTINPFYIFGDVGLGKTHLMNAIGHSIVHQNINTNVVYVTSQQFVDDFFKAKNKNQKNLSLVEDFDRFYSQADVLLIDDIQFLENKQGSQEEFFKIFEELFNNDKQIIVTSDRPASELNIMDRLKSRFSWGMQANLKKPNLELRKEILRNKLKYLIDTPTDVPEDVISYICENFSDNVRELEGAIRRFISYCVSFNLEFNLENAIISLEPIINNSKKGTNDKNNSKLEDIKDAVVRYFNINAKDLTSTSRKKNLVYARSLAVYLAKSKFDISFNQLGDSLGNRDHTTIIHSYQKMSELINSDEMVRLDAENIIKIINQK